MAAANWGFLALSQLLMLLGLGGGGLPLGLPPGPEDPVMARVAPEECLFYTTWTGMATPDPKSRNQTEQLLAEPQVRQFAVELEKRVRAGLRAGVAKQDPNIVPAFDAAAGFLHQVVTRPTAIFVGKVDLGQGRAPSVRGGAIVNLGDEAAQVRTALEKHQRTILGRAPEEVTIAGATWYRINPGQGAPVFTWGVHKSYFVLGVGDEEVEAMLKRMEAAPPKWFGEIRRQLPVERRATVSYVNLATIRSLVGQAAGPQGNAVIEALGLDKVNTLVTVTGLEGTGFVSRSLVSMTGEPSGLLTIFAGKPLEAKDLRPIPRDALFALAARKNAAQMWEAFGAVVQKADPRAWNDMSQGLSMAENRLGINLRDDVLKPLGDVWCLYAPGGEAGLIPTGLTLVGQVDDAKRLGQTLEKLTSLAKAEFDRERQARGRAPELKQFELAGQKIFYLEVGERGFPVTPSWCLTDKELIVALYPQAVKTYLSRGKDFQSLANVPDVAKALSGKDGPVILGYQNVPELFRLVYPFVQIGAQALASEASRHGIDLDVSILPSADVIRKHLHPGVTVVKRTGAGIEMTTRQSLPGGNIGAAAPVAIGLLVPAVQSARSAARRSMSMNNLKQIGLAMHNYHDTYRTLPPAYKADKEGKPLLSWRVLILPFIEQQALYQQFHLDEPWDSEHNKKLIAQMPAVYRSPTSRAEPGKTNYLTIRGKNTVFPGKEGLSFAAVTDGTSNTIMTVEASDDRAVIWTKPDDFEPDPKDPIKGLVGLQPGGFLAGFADGSVRFIRATIKPKTLELLFDRQDGQPIPGDQY